jgi:hypothetical protein
LSGRLCGDARVVRRAAFGLVFLGPEWSGRRTAGGGWIWPLHHGTTECVIQTREIPDRIYC